MQTIISEGYTAVSTAATVSDSLEMKKTVFIIAAILFSWVYCAAQDSIATVKKIQPGPVVDIHTTAGDIKVKLYDDTPLHRDNFLKLAKEGYYDNVLFHRVIKDFMVQTGDPDSKDAAPGAMLGSGGPDYGVKAEIVYPEHYHKYGALAAARSGDNVNPLRESSGSQFYIVTGKKYPESTVVQLSQKAFNEMLNTKWGQWVDAHRAEIAADPSYSTAEGGKALQERFLKEIGTLPDSVPAGLVEEYVRYGGTPFLDGQYTVFGEVLEGMDVVEKIQNAPTDANDRPTEDVRILSVDIE